MPLRDYQCNEPQCQTKFESYVKSGEEAALQQCPKCSKIGSSLLPALVGNYRINGDNSSSTRPRGSGAFNRRGKNGK